MYWWNHTYAYKAAVRGARGEGRRGHRLPVTRPVTVTVVNRQCWEPRVAWSSASDGFSVLVLREGVGATRLIWHCAAPLPGRGQAYLTMRPL
jgi:hypothetical protein